MSDIVSLNLRIDKASSYSDIIESIYNNNTHLLTDKITNKTKPRHSLVDVVRSFPLLNKILPAVDEKKLLIETLIAQQKSATTYKSWYKVSLQLDEVLGNNVWKYNPESNLYDYDLIYNNMKEMQNARLNKDYKLLLYLIRTKWIRNIGNMGNIDLYRHSHVGTKRLIEEYNSECQLSLQYLISGKDVNLDDRYLLGMLIQTRKNIGRTALVLSGGSTFGVFHIGVLITLLELNLLPRIISGSSAGSIIASILCCHTNEETATLLNTITDRKFNIFGESLDDSPTHNKFKNFLNSISHLLKYGTLFDIDGLQETMNNFVGDLTFREAYNRTGKILNITVSPASTHEQTRLLNYLTAPNCLIWSAVCASCSLPGIFPSTSIYEKNPRTNEIHEWNNDVTMKYVDGSVDNDLPITRLLEMFNVDHIIAVQVNPHVIPVLKISISSVGGEIENELNSRLRELLNNCYDFVTCEIVHYLQILSEMNIYRNVCGKFITLLSQSYSGDVTILPDLSITDFMKIFENPTPVFLLDFIIRGARASWPKVTVINNHCGVEFALDKAISLLRGRLITSSNNRITGLDHSSNNIATLMDNSASSNNYYTLVNSPILNDERINFESSPAHNLKNDYFKRHNSVSNSVSSSPSKLPAKNKRNSISSQNAATRNTRKGKSTISLVSLGANSEKSPEPIADGERPDIFSRYSEQNTKTRNYTEGYSGAVVKKHQKEFDDEKNIRKSKSSGNFHKESDPDSNKNKDFELKYQSERIPYYKGNPYLDSANRLRKQSFESDDESPVKQANSSVLFGNLVRDSLDSDKPNLPKRSNNNSLRNSYVGLNGLKDNRTFNKSNNSSYSNSQSNSNSNSYYNLKDQGRSAEAFKSLYSPDLRRHLTRNSDRDKKRGLFSTSDDEAPENGTKSKRNIIDTDLDVMGDKNSSVGFDDDDDDTAVGDKDDSDDKNDDSEDADSEDNNNSAENSTEDREDDDSTSNLAE